MSDHDQVARVENLVARWKPRLKLDHWKIAIHPAKEPPINTKKGFAEVLAISGDWRYMKAMIFVRTANTPKFEEAQLEQSVVHELAHLLLNELADSTRADYEDHEERVCSLLTSVFLGLAKGE